MIYRPDTWKQHFPLSTFQAHIPVHFLYCSFVFPRGWSFSKSTIGSGIEGLYFSHIFGFVEFYYFSTSFPRKPCVSLAVVSVAL